MRERDQRHAGGDPDRSHPPSIRTLHFDQNYEWIVIGCAIAIAVRLDQSSTRFAARRLTASGARGPRAREPG
jgi:hypothetical protein